MDDHHHPRILLAVVRERWDEVAERVGRGPFDADRFVECCRQSDAHPWVHALLERDERGALVGRRALNGLQRLRDKVRRDNLLLVARAEQALGLLLGAGVVPVALKGLDLLHRLYGSFDQRTLDDVDLLVDRDDLSAALRALEAGGWVLPEEPRRTHYIRSSHHLPLRSPGPVTVDFEIHWNLAQEQRYRIDPRGLLDRSLPLSIAGHSVRRLEDHDLVAHLLIHHFSHYFDRRLKWLIDLRAVAAQPGFDWSRVAARIREWGGGAACGVSLRHLQKMDPDLIPEAALRELPVAAWRRALTWPLRSNHPLELFRHSDRRRTQLYLAAVMLEHPLQLPAWLIHRSTRDQRAGDNPLDGVYPGDDQTTRKERG